MGRHLIYWKGRFKVRAALPVAIPAPFCSQFFVCLAGALASTESKPVYAMTAPWQDQFPVMARSTRYHESVSVAFSAEKEKWARVETRTSRLIGLMGWLR